jgi:hypothetical protein
MLYMNELEEQYTSYLEQIKDQVGAHTSFTYMMMMMSISPFGHKAVGDLSRGQNISTSITRALYRGFLAIHFVKAKWYLLINSLYSILYKVDQARGAV